MRGKWIALGLACCLGWPALAHAITINQIDDFQDGTTQFWGTGAPDPDPPTNTATGGPAGAGDRFLEITSAGGGGAGSKMAVFNTAQWTGDYNSAGVTVVRADLNNLGSTDLDIRLRLEGPGGNFFSVNAVSLSAGSGWTTVDFGLSAADMTGDADLAATLSGVTKAWFFHNPDPFFPGPPSNADLGVDNITALPEPGALLLLAAGVLPVVRRRQAR